MEKNSASTSSASTSPQHMFTWCSLEDGAPLDSSSSIAITTTATNLDDISSSDQHLNASTWQAPLDESELATDPLLQHQRLRQLESNTSYYLEETYNRNSKRKKPKNFLYHHNMNPNNIHQIHKMGISTLLLLAFLSQGHAFTLTQLQTKTTSLSFMRQQRQYPNVHVRTSTSILTFATKSKSSAEETIQAVQPLTSSTQEKRMSVQRAWEQAKLFDLDMDVDMDNVDVDGSSDSLSATPFLDLFADAGIANVKKVQKSPSKQSQNVKPRGRPASVPGAMSRATMMGRNEIENRTNAKNNSKNNSNSNHMNSSSNSNSRTRRQPSDLSLDLNDERYAEGRFRASITPSRLGNRNTSARISRSNIDADSANGKKKKSSSAILNNMSKKKKRGRGRPRKDKGNNASIDEITSIAATSTSSQVDVSTKSRKSNDVSKASPVSSKDGRNQMNNESSATNNDKSALSRNKRGELKTLRIKSNKYKDNRKEQGETSGMMQTGRKGNSIKAGKDAEPPNLQRYYRTELLTPQEEYTLGMKIQFMINCELVYEGLSERLGRGPSIVEWAAACGFKEEDVNKDDANYLQSDYVKQIRPLKSDAFDPVEDANMFVGNGLVNASGPGRGRGRAKKPPPAKLQAYYDDSHIKFQDDFLEKEKLLKPLNRGTPMRFVELMVTSREAKQRMVQCNMRLVVSISKRYKHVGVNIADLVQEGSIGLTRAAEKFDPKKGFKFSTYASWWIQQAVFRSIAYHSRTIRLPVHVHNLLNRTRRVRLELQRILGRAPTNKEMAAELDMTLEKYNKMELLTRKAISLDMAKYQNNPKDIGQESETSLGDTIDASNVIRDESSPEQSVDRNLFRDDLKEMLKILGDDERAVVYSRYGIEDGLTRTVTTVAAQMGQSKSWVRSQECRALRKLRRPWYEKRLWEHQNSLTG